MVFAKPFVPTLNKVWWPATSLRPSALRFVKQVLWFTSILENEVCQADQLGESAPGAAAKDQQFISKKDFGTHGITAPMEPD